MSHLAAAESDPDFTNLQIERFRQATAEALLWETTIPRGG